MEAIRAAISEIILPDLNQLKQDLAELKTAQSMTNKRLDDINTHLADQSRRIDAMRTDIVHSLDETNKRINGTNERIDRLYEVIVRREEFSETVMKIMTLEREVADIKHTIAA